MRRQFAEKANSVGPWIERQMDAVASIAMGMQVCRSSFERLRLWSQLIFFWGVFLGLFGGSIGTFEGIRAKRLRLQVAYGRTGEAQPRHPRIDGLWKPIHPVHHGNAASRLGAIAHLYQSQYQRSWKPDSDTRFERYQSLNVALCVFLSAGNVNFWPAHHPKRVFKKKKKETDFLVQNLMDRRRNCWLVWADVYLETSKRSLNPCIIFFFFFFKYAGVVEMCFFVALVLTESFSMFAL